MSDPLTRVAVTLHDFVAKAGPRRDWHGPGEQNITCEVVGDDFDSAFGAQIMKPAAGFQEIVVRLSAPGCDVDINLATLCALATVGANRLLKKEEPAPDPRSRTSFDPLWSNK